MDKAKYRSGTGRKFINAYRNSCTEGVRVAVPRSKEKNDVITKLFSFKKYGGKRKALAAAQEYRDELLRELKNEHLLSKSHVYPAQHNRSAKNNSGVIGVRLFETSSKGNTYESWGVTYNQNGKGVQRSFSTTKYGFCEAFRLACKVRYENVGELIVLVPIKDLPCHPKLPYRKRMAKGDGRP